MKIRKYTLLSLVACAMLFIQSCKCDDPSDPSCPNFDPCLCVNKDFANFKMEEALFYNGEGAFYQTDTTLENNNVRLTIYDQTVDSVKWIIGADPNIRKGKSINLTFEEAFGEIPITTIAYKQKAADCLGEEAGIDTLTKSIYVLEWWKAPYFGKFSGTTSEDPNKEFITEIDTISSYRGYTKRIKVALLKNFPNGYSMPVPTDGVLNLYRPFTYLGYRGFISIISDDLDNIRANYNPKSRKLQATYFFNPHNGKDWNYEKSYQGEKTN